MKLKVISAPIHIHDGGACNFISRNRLRANAVDDIAVKLKWPGGVIRRERMLAKFYRHSSATRRFWAGRPDIGTRLWLVCCPCFHRPNRHQRRGNRQQLKRPRGAGMVRLADKSALSSCAGEVSAVASAIKWWPRRVITVCRDEARMLCWPRVISSSSLILVDCLARRGGAVVTLSNR